MMPWFRKLTESEKNLRYLQGSVSHLPKEEHKFYELSISCLDEHRSNPVSTFESGNVQQDKNHDGAGSGILKQESPSNESCTTQADETSNGQTEVCEDGGSSTTHKIELDHRIYQHYVIEESASETANTQHNHQDKDSMKQCDVKGNVAQKSQCSNSIRLPCKLEVRHFEAKGSLPPPISRQTYTMWKAGMDLTLRFWRIRRRKTIYIQPLDTFPSFIENFAWQGRNSGGQFFQLLQEFANIFFMGFDIKILPNLDMKEAGWSITTRNHRITGKKQYLVSDVNKSLEGVLPSDGFCMIGVCWTDLYPTEALNFVLGEAAVKYNSATFCFGHYEPKSYVEGKQPITEIDGFILWRMIKVISHETCHIFGLSHCVFFHCAMNESTSMQQALSQPLFLCPVCLRKIQKVCQFSIRSRYMALLNFLQMVHLEYPSQYTENGIAWLKQIVIFLDSDA